MENTVTELESNENPQIENRIAVCRKAAEAQCVIESQRQKVIVALGDAYAAVRDLVEEALDDNDLPNDEGIEVPIDRTAKRFFRDWNKEFEEKSGKLLDLLREVAVQLVSTFEMQEKARFVVKENGHPTPSE